MVVAVDGRGGRRPVAVAFRAERQPDGHQKAAVLQLNAVPGSGRDDAPVISRTEGVESRGDLDRRREGLAVVAAVHVEDAHVLDAEKEVHGSVTVGDGDGVVVSDVGGLPLLALDRHRVAYDGARHLPDRAERRKICPAVRTSPHHNIDGVPIPPGIAPSLGIDQDRAAVRHHDAGDTVELAVRIDVVIEIGLLRRGSDPELNQYESTL